MSTLNTYKCDKCEYSVVGYTKMKPFKYRSLLSILLKKKSKIEYEYKKDYHNTPCSKCDGGILHIDQKATVFFHDKKEPKLVSKSNNLHIFKTKRIDYECTNCWYKIHGHQSLYRNMKGILSNLFLRGFLAKYSEPLFAINQNFQDLECPMCKTGTFVELLKED